MQYSVQTVLRFVTAAAKILIYYIRLSYLWTISGAFYRKNTFAYLIKQLITCI